MLPRNFLGTTERYHEKISLYLVSGLKFEPTSPIIQRRNANHLGTNLDHVTGYVNAQAKSEVPLVLLNHVINMYRCCGGNDPRIIDLDGR